MTLLEQTKYFLKKEIKVTPQLAIISGSGVKIFPGNNPLVVINYTDLPIWSKQHKKSSALNVKGHEGKLKLLKIKDKYVLVFSGRKHLYQGLDITQVVANTRIAFDLGINQLIITNAAGGINTNFKAGDLMLITGFMDLIQSNERGTIAALSQSPKIVKSSLTSKIAKFNEIIHKGIYAGVIGPSYDTFAEIKLLKSLGADAVGMSTIPELITAKSLGLHFAGISIISNVWSKKHKPSHKDVLNNVEKANNKLNSLILKLLK